MRRFLPWLLISFMMSMMFGPRPIQAQDGGLPRGSEAPGIADDVQEPFAMDIVASSFAGSPSYDSGWYPLQQGQGHVFYHGLGGDAEDYVVVLDYKSKLSGINQRYYGGIDFGAKSFSGTRNNHRVGAYWRDLTTDSIRVFRRHEDIYAEWVRVRIWIDPYADYDSGWVTLTPAAAKTLTHGLGGDVNDYVAYLQYKSNEGEMHQRFLGGADFGAKTWGGAYNHFRMGVYWRSLTTTTITLFRRAEDLYAAQARVRIWRRPRPTYDSGWISLNQNQAKTLIHNIGGNPDHYIVDMQYRSSGSGINLRYYGGVDFGNQPPPGMNEDDRAGAYWRSLTANSITVYRRPEDVYAPEVRIRIWHYWRPTPPDFDSGWVGALAGGPAKTLLHNLGGSADEYLVRLTYKTSDVNGINLRYYGGADFGVHPAPGHAADDRVAAYWRTLTNNAITIFRRAEDSYAPNVRVRIWRMPKPDYDSGWLSINQGQAKTLEHQLAGSVYNYLVDLQYRSSGSGVNQRYYGGVDFGSKPPLPTNENDRVGAYWRTLTNRRITVYRRPDDLYAPEVRVRIWRISAPNYDSGWVAVDQNQAIPLNHRLASDPENYLVSMWQYDSAFNYTNQRHFGGADFGSNPPAGYAENDRVGAYWRSLTDNSVTVYRRPEDGFADRIRVRIWDYRRVLYLPLMQK